MINGDKSLAPLARLLVGHAGGQADRHALLWAYDARLADIVRTTREPMVGQMRLTWWHEVLSDDGATKGRGDPLVDALRADRDVMAARDPMLRMIDGWEALLDLLPLDDAALRAFAEGRGGGLFRALDRAADERAGALWALWDLSGHIGDAVTAQRAVSLAQDYLAARLAGAKPLRMLTRLARHDIGRGQPGPATMTPRLYARLLRMALPGR
ncbi:squalene/phytoene synthase family protein [Sphingobium algorifonticola]|uniref:Phytoene synthase n=1 Tax=Sphingobium algorifonticola TaxID=2008318 RepID=A0A437JB32_9SPHN|nr:squalene/phytoene synthase family protein [Sphingobium algorifonticola]RVT43119.1 hypothetical protein ENE74_00300 [Sphingobium algorifonticola]